MFSIQNDWKNGKLFEKLVNKLTKSKINHSSDENLEIVTSCKF